MKTAVVDMGSARTKVTLCEMGSKGEYRFSNRAIETALSWHIMQGEIHTAIEAVKKLLWELPKELKEQNVTHMLFIGTQIFREHPVLLETARSVIPGFALLTPQQEAVFFYESVRMEEKPQSEFWALDIGGGSIQLVWSPAAKDHLSAPIGSYVLEKMFYPDNIHAMTYSSRGWEEMQDYIRKMIVAAPFDRSKDKILIVGSSIMKNFFASALRQEGSFNRPEIDTLMRVLSSKAYIENYNLYPADTAFLHGSDKLLGIVMAVLSAGQFGEVRATNASLSKGLCMKMTEHPGFAKIVASAI